ncbi:hypothetical protein ACTJKO_17215 [Curtobacterium sp. 22159]|uniref:hypothetical protein n=1 Tax=Curtobacterium sp. 22159 TaxID=3453882 RepID=UPI003F8429FC
MDWWNDLTDWISSDNGWRIVSGAIIPFVAIVVAGIVAALIGRGATKRVVAMQEREARNSAVAGVVSAARKAATWGSLGHDERAYADHLAEDADIRLRLLPVSGAPLAANWAQHEIADIKKNSSTFSFQAEQSLAEFRDRLLEWQARPNRARKLFKSDLERWKFDAPDPDTELIARQQEWNADQSRPSGATDGAAPTTATPAASTAPAAERPTPTTTSLRPAAQRSGAAGTAPASAPSAAPAFSVTRGAAPAADPNATTPLSDAGATRNGADGATRSYGDGATPPTRAPLGPPASPARPASATSSASPAAPHNAGPRTDDAAGAHDAVGAHDAIGSGDAVESHADEVDVDNADAVDDAPSSRSVAGAGVGVTKDAPVPPAVAKPTTADSHVNRTEGSSTTHTTGSSTTHTTSVPTRIAGPAAEPTDPDETSEATYTQPISASELRRRAADDDE